MTGLYVPSLLDCGRSEGSPGERFEQEKAMKREIERWREGGREEMEIEVERARARERERERRGRQVNRARDRER